MCKLGVEPGFDHSIEEMATRMYNMYASNLFWSPLSLPALPATPHVQRAPWRLRGCARFAPSTRPPWCFGPADQWIQWMNRRSITDAIYICIIHMYIYIYVYIYRVQNKRDKQRNNESWEAGTPKKKKPNLANKENNPAIYKYEYVCVHLYMYIWSVSLSM